MISLSGNLYCQIKLHYLCLSFITSTIICIGIMIVMSICDILIKYDDDNEWQG